MESWFSKLATTKNKIIEYILYKFENDSIDNGNYLFQGRISSVDRWESDCN